MTVVMCVQPSSISSAWRWLACGSSWLWQLVSPHSCRWAPLCSPKLQDPHLLALQPRCSLDAAANLVCVSCHPDSNMFAYLICTLMVHSEAAKLGTTWHFIT